MDLRLSRWNSLSLLFAVYSIVAGLAWLVKGGTTPVALLAVGGHFALAGVLVIVFKNINPDFQFPRIVILVPWIFWVLAWSEIGWIYEIFPPVYFDQAIIQLDLAVFGNHLNETLPGWWSGGILREFFTGIYLSYYLLILGPPVVLAFRRRWTTLLDHTFGLMLTYLACFAIYLILPVQGPRDMALAAGGLAAEEFAGFFPQIMDALFRSGDSLGTAFPSSHCAGATASALLCRRFFSGRIGIVCGIWATLIVISTIHTNNHYAIDAVAGISLAALAHFKEAHRETHTHHRSNRIYRATSCLPSPEPGAQASRSGAGSA